jgi:hypothetical protein
MLEFPDKKEHTVSESWLLAMGLAKCCLRYNHLPRRAALAEPVWFSGAAVEFPPSCDNNLTHSAESLWLGACLK